MSRQKGVVSRILLGASLALSSVLLSGTLWSQVTTGIISGTVKDASGSVVPGASVKIIHTETGTSHTATADPAGRYVIPQLALGEYEVTAEMSGFKSEVRKGIVLTVGKEVVADFTLEVGTVTEQVVVTAETPLIETRSSSLAGLVDEKQVRDLPLNGRSFDQLINLTTGTVQFDAKNRNVALGFTSGFSSGGARWEASKFTWDGVEFLGSSSVATTPNSASGKLMGVEAIREFAVITNNADASYGKKFGGIINVITRSGTNEFHGDVYEFLRNSHLDARNFFDPAKIPAFKQNNFGAAGGGPIKKDKAWFFANYEGFRTRLGLSNVALVPDADARRGFLPSGPGGALVNVGIVPGVVPLMQFYPEPNGGNLGQGIARALSSPSEKVNDDFGVARVDYNLSDLHTLFGHYLVDNATVSSPRVNPHFAVTSPSRAQQATVGLRSTFSPTVLNSFTMGFTRAVGSADVIADIPIPPSLITEVGATGLGNIAVTGLNELGGFNTAALLAGRFQNRNVFTFADQVNISKGKHFLQLGTQIERIQANENQGTTRRGNWTITSLQNLLQGNALTLQSAIPGSNGEKGYRQKFVSFFVQDNFRPWSNFTLNLGLRYEFMTNVAEVNGRLANYRLVDNEISNPMQTTPVVRSPLYDTNNSLKGIAPRLGFAWDVTGKGTTAIRGGFGVFYSQIEDDFRRMLGADPPFFTVLSGNNIPFPSTSAALVSLGGLVRPFGVDPNSDIPTLLQYNLRVEQSLGGKIRVAAAYVGSHGFHLSRFIDPQQPNPILLSDGRLGLPTGSVQKVATLSTTGTGYVKYDANSFYNSLQVDVETRISKTLQLKTSYTWSKSLDDGSGTLALTGGSTTSRFAVNHVADRGFSAFDIPQRFSTNATYTLPLASWLRKSNRLVDGWEMSGIVQVQSGVPFAVASGISTLLPNGTITAGGVDVVPGRNLGNIILGRPEHSRTYFDLTAYLVPPANHFGQVGRNTMRGPGITTMDLALQKQTKLTERLGLRIRADAFNLLNHPNFKFPSVLSVFNNNGTISASGGVITETSNFSREIQFSLKLIF